METAKTKVTIQQTAIKYFNEFQNSVATIEVVGNLNITESKKYLAENDLGIFITREVTKESFEVNTTDLIALRG